MNAQELQEKTKMLFSNIIYDAKISRKIIEIIKRRFENNELVLSDQELKEIDSKILNQENEFALEKLKLKDKNDKLNKSKYKI